MLLWSAPHKLPRSKQFAELSRVLAMYLALAEIRIKRNLDFRTQGINNFLVCEILRLAR
jgi:hypothetical protein